MHTRIVKPKRGPTLLVRPLRRGDTDTVNAMFERLGQRSRRTRFNGPKPRLSAGDLEQLSAAADPNHHVLVAYVQGDPRPAALARLIRDGQSAEIAFEVADELQHRGIGSALTGRADRGCPRGRDHRDHRPRGERQSRRGGAVAQDPERARHPLRGARALDPRRAAVTGGYPPAARASATASRIRAAPSERTGSPCAIRTLRTGSAVNPGSQARSGSPLLVVEEHVKPAPRAAEHVPGNEALDGGDEEERLVLVTVGKQRLDPGRKVGRRRQHRALSNGQPAEPRCSRRIVPRPQPHHARATAR